MASKAIKANCTMDDWRKTVKVKYDNLKQTVDENIPALWMPLEFVISARCILNVKNITIPFIGIILGPPGTGKTQSTNIPKYSRDSFFTDNFSAHSFVSHDSSKSEDELKEQDLLPKMKNKLFLVSELAPLFTTKEDDLANVLGIVTRIADGEGYWSDTGAKGHRGYDGPIMFVWIGAAVDIPYKIHKLLSILGPKLYFLRLPMASKTEQQLVKSMRRNDFPERLNRIKSAFFDYLEYFESCPKMEVDPASGLPKIQWNAETSEQLKPQEYIAKLAELLAYLRGTVTVWTTDSDQGDNKKEYVHASKNVEDRARCRPVT